MTVYSLNLKVFWLFVAFLLTCSWCLFLVLRRDGGGVEDRGGCQENGFNHLQHLLKLCFVFLLFYTVARCCRSTSPCHHQGNSDPIASPKQNQQQLRKTLLESFYEHHIKLSPHVLGHSKAHVSQIVGELIKVGKAKQQDTGVTFRGDFVQIGSAYEQHKINSPDCFDILVPLKIPQSLKLEPLFTVGGKDSAPVSRGSLMCGVAAPRKSEWAKTYKQFSDYFCSETLHGHHLSSAMVLKWFHWKIQRCLNVIRYQFEERCHITLSMCDEKLILKILPRSDYVCCHISMSVRLIPAFHLGDSVFLTAQVWSGGPHLDTVSHDAYWGVNFSKHEQKFLNWFKDQAPANSCHLKCLQIMKALRDLNNVTFQPFLFSHWRAILSSYNLKTTLFYLLVSVPVEKWDDSLLMDRMMDFLLFLKECLQSRVLMHFFLGNRNSPTVITLPKMFKDAQPVNLLEGYSPDLLDQVCFQLFNMWVQIPQILKIRPNPKSLFREQARCKHTNI